MSLFTKMIASCMENPEARDVKWRAHMNAMRHNADVLKSQWDKPNKYDGYWKSKEMTQKTDHEERLGERGKGFWQGNAGTDTNSIGSVLEGLEKN